MMQVLDEDSKTVVRCAVGVTDGYKVGVGLHLQSDLNPLLFPLVIDRLTDEVSRSLRGM